MDVSNMNVTKLAVQFEVNSRYIQTSDESHLYASFEIVYYTLLIKMILLHRHLIPYH